MAKVAGYRYEDCTNGRDWFNKKEWTAKQKAKYKRWYYLQMETEMCYSLDYTWEQWDRLFGFNVVL